MEGGRRECGSRGREGGEEDLSERLSPAIQQLGPRPGPTGARWSGPEGGRAVQEVLPPPPALGSTALWAAVVPTWSFLRS